MLRKKEREPSRFETGDAALKLSVHTMNITSNPKIFNPMHGGIINRLKSDSALIYHLVRTANDVRVKGEKDARKRTDMQNQAYELCDRMTTMIMISQGLFHLRFSKAEYWNSLVERTQVLIHKWQKSDFDRYKEKGYIWDVG